MMSPRNQGVKNQLDNNKNEKTDISPESGTTSSIPNDTETAKNATVTELEQPLVKDSDQGSTIASTSVQVKSASFNPSVSDDEGNEEDLEKIKGDAIGNTLYSERFVLSTLLKLTTFETELGEDESFEKDLCSLWDMTIEEDVVKLLLEHNVLELFAGIIDKTNDKRMTEVILGIIANMCNVQQTRDKLCDTPEVMSTIVSLVSCSDSLSLIQLMRLFYATIGFEDSGDEIVWLQHFRNTDNFVENFAFILSNSINASLLVHALEALNAICAKFVIIELQPDNNSSFCDIFVKEPLIKGTIEAFKTLIPQNSLHRQQEADDTATPSQNTKKIMSLFLDIHVILSQYEEASRRCYEPNMSDIMKCMSQVLSPLCQPIYLLPLTLNEQGIIENINEVFQALGDPFDEICFAQMINIWSLIDTDRDAKYRRLLNSNGEEFESDDDEENDEVNWEDICMSILEFITRSVRTASKQQLERALQMNAPRTVLKLLSALNAGDSEKDIKECCTKIKSAFETLHSASNGETA